MPKGITFNDGNIMERFRTSVQESVPYSLKINKNIALLSRDIYAATHTSVSISTLKRIFLYPNTTAPSIFTLDVICRAVGYISWDHFLKNVDNKSEHLYKDLKTRIMQNGYRDFEEFKELVSINLNSSNNYEILLELLRKAVQKNDFETLSQLFEIEFFKEEINYEPLQFYFAQELGLILRLSPIIHKLIPFYVKSPAAHQWYIERFVDEDNLNGYYGEMLEQFSRYKKTPEAQLFYHGLMCVRDLENGISYSDHFKFMILFREEMPVHYLPLSRRLAILTFMFNSDRTLINSLIYDFQSLLNKISIAERAFPILIYCRIVFEKNDYTAIRKMLDYLHSNPSTENSNISSLRDLNYLKIYETAVLFNEGKQKEAKSTYETFDPYLLCPYQQNKYNRHHQIVRKMIESV